MIEIGERLDGKYLVSGMLGSGGFGVVFLAGDTDIPGRKVALKVLWPGPAGHDDLIWEMRTLARFNHPGVVGFHHHFMHRGQLVLAMEYCEGGSLAHRLDTGGAIEVNEAFRVGAVLCDTLSSVHQKGIVHHDIKPENILFSLDGAVKLGDFGVANRNTGTRIYMAPELLLREPVARTDPRIDVYALALMLVEMITGQHPFEAMNADDAMKSRIAHDFIPDTLPRWVQDILLKATHPTPELRFQNVRDFGEAIQARHVPYVFDSTRIKVHALATRAEALLARKKWKRAEQQVAQALRLCPNSAAALVAAGRCHLMLRRTKDARRVLDRALSVNPRLHVQKELGQLNLEEGNFPIAISLLSDHIDRNAADFEAFNLLLKCFFLSGRYEAGETLARVVMKEKLNNDCFRNNRFICRLMNGGYTDADLAAYDLNAIENPFIAYNLAVAREQPSSWTQGGKPALQDKLLFQEWGFGAAAMASQKNTLAIRLPDGIRHEPANPVVSLGSLTTNQIKIDGGTVSRRHAAIVNFQNDVWLYDLGSTCGVRLDGNAVSGRMYLDGVHELELGTLRITVSARADLLV